MSIAVALMCGCVGPNEEQDEGRSSDELTVQSSPIETIVYLTVVPGTFASGVWSVVSPDTVQLIAHVVDSPTASPVNGGTVQFEQCIGGPNDTTCPDRFRRISDPAMVDGGVAFIYVDSEIGGNRFYRAKYLPHGNGFKRQTSSAIRVVGVTSS